MPTASGLPPAAVLVPLRAFRDAKTRLSGVLTTDERSALARTMATRVVMAAGPLPTAVVTADAGVTFWARGLGCTVLTDPGRGLDRAVVASVGALGRAGFARVIVAHGDLPLARDLSWLAATTGVVIVPDRRDDGTNVLALPTGCPFGFAYGPGSAVRHGTSARRLGLEVSVVRDPSLAWDVDNPEDLDWPNYLTAPPSGWGQRGATDAGKQGTSCGGGCR